MYIKAPRDAVEKTSHNLQTDVHCSSAECLASRNFIIRVLKATSISLRSSVMQMTRQAPPRSISRQPQRARHQTTQPLSARGVFDLPKPDRINIIRTAQPGKAGVPGCNNAAKQRCESSKFISYCCNTQSRNLHKKLDRLTWFLVQDFSCTSFLQRIQHSSIPYKKLACT